MQRMPAVAGVIEEGVVRAVAIDHQLERIGSLDGDLLDHAQLRAGMALEEQLESDLGAARAEEIPVVLVLPGREAGGGAGRARRRQRGAGGKPEMRLAPRIKRGVALRIEVDR